MIKNKSLDTFKNKLFGDFLALDGLTEIAVNRPNQLFTKVNGVWQKHTHAISLDQCMQFSTALANYNKDHVEDIKPILSATLESGERCQIVMPPACQGDTVSITIRKPSKLQIPHQSYIDSGFYSRVMGSETADNHDTELLRLYSENIPLFMEKCVEYGKVILFVGKTSSGKTTYMKTLIGYIPLGLRIVTIEDNPEIEFRQHENYVHLFYPSECGEDAIVSPASLIRANFRMNPDRILLTEVRGPEAWDALKIIGSGHDGLITSMHAGTPTEAIDGLVTRCYQNPECRQLPYSVLLRKVLDSVDVIASIDVNSNVRRMGDVYFKPVHRQKFLEEFTK
ncbi:P-type DNA transfer ATPase VirB11 [Yersinia pseudotuberculosis]|uniref:P-type DNA transfer ATPase VirB11 n=1 Tax=Yersinia pseudotuberculosis TaxID=633 RepID=UPI0005DD2BD0|nr:P-type DNA transfer ATPase VirB11 [Yersinia pseudotuberculosis]CNM04175.1 TriJ protein [Yersinia pseudotuberculosis]